MSRKLGKIVANHKKKGQKDVIEEYKKNLSLIFKKPPKYTNYINSLMHIFGYFSKELNEEEKNFILDSFDKYREDKVHLSVPVNLLKTYVLRFKDKN